MKPRVVGFLLTLRCNAACRHCCFECSPKRTESMPLADAVAFVREIARIDYLRGISITGGEPFLEYKTLRAVLNEVGANSLKARIVTNCFWAVDASRAKKLLVPLIKQGLSELSVSYDEVHREFVPKERVGVAVRTALELGLKVVISTTTINGNILDCITRVQNELGLKPHKDLYIMPGYIARNGRALESFSGDSFCYTSKAAREGKRLEQPCPHVIREPIITPSGDLAACCSPSTATRTGFVDSFVVGNLHQDSLKDILETLENDLVFNIFMLEGPWALYRLIQENDPSAMPVHRFINICDLCYRILSSRKVRNVLEKCLRGRGADIVAKKLYIEAIAGGNVDDYLGLKAGVFRLRPQR